MPFSIAGPASPALPSLDGINRATDRISSGLRIDYQQNAAEAAISGRFDTAIGESTISIRNAINQTSALQKADQTLGQGTDTLERIKALQIQSGNGALNETDRQAIAEEAQGLLEQFSDDLANAEFNDSQLFGSQGIDVERLQTKLDDIRDSGTLSLDDVAELSEEAMRLRSGIGAEQSAIEQEVAQVTGEGIALSSQSSLNSDADLATEMVNLLREQIQFEASVKVFDHRRVAEQSILELLS